MFRNWLKRIFATRQADDEFSKQIKVALGGLREKTEEFTTGVMDYAMEKEMAELRERITKLEAVILPMRNGAPVRH